MLAARVNSPCQHWIQVLANRRFGWSLLTWLAQLVFSAQGTSVKYLTMPLDPLQWNSGDKLLSFSRVTSTETIYSIKQISESLCTIQVQKDQSGTLQASRLRCNIQQYIQLNGFLQGPRHPALEAKAPVGISLFGSLVKLHFHQVGRLQILMFAAPENDLCLELLVMSNGKLIPDSRMGPF